MCLCDKKKIKWLIRETCFVSKTFDCHLVIVVYILSISGNEEVSNSKLSNQNEFCALISPDNRIKSMSHKLN